MKVAYADVITDMDKLAGRHEQRCRLLRTFDEVLDLTELGARREAQRAVRLRGFGDASLTIRAHAEGRPTWSPSRIVRSNMRHPRCRARWLLRYRAVRAGRAGTSSKAQRAWPCH